MKARTSMNGLLLIFFLYYKLQSSSKYLWVQFILWATISCLHLWSAEIQAVIPTIYLSQYLWETRCCGHKLLHAHIHPSCVPESLGGAGRQAHSSSHTLRVPCVHLAKAGACKQRASLLACLHCFRFGVLCCSGLARWKTLINKSLLLPRYTGGKTDRE